MQRNKNNDEAAKGFDTKFVVATALKLLLISAVTALLLSGVNALTKDTIAENDAKEKSAAIAAIFPDSDSSESADVTIDGVNGVWLVTSGGDILGYAASVRLRRSARHDGRRKLRRDYRGNEDCLTL